MFVLKNSKRFLIAAVLIGEAHDVVLAEITTDLNFDQFKWDFPRVGEAVDAADGDISRTRFHARFGVQSRQ